MGQSSSALWEVMDEARGDSLGPDFLGRFNFCFSNPGCCSAVSPPSAGSAVSFPSPPFRSLEPERIVIFPGSFNFGVCVWPLPPAQNGCGAFPSYPEGSAAPLQKVQAG